MLLQFEAAQRLLDMYDLEGHRVLYGGKLLEKTCGIPEKWADQNVLDICMQEVYIAPLC